MRIKWIGLFACLAYSSAAWSLDCIKPSDTERGAPLRAAPSATSASLGRLSSEVSLPLLAIIPRWYETRMPSGQSAFISKQASDIVPCGDDALTGSEDFEGYELHAIDVGTGLAILIRGSDFALLYDAGTNDDLARGIDNRVVSYLKALDVPLFTIDHVLLSHPHRDHVELLPDVFAEFEVLNVWNSGAYNDICGYRRFLAAVAQEAGVQYHTANRGEGTETITLRPKKCYGVQEPLQTITLTHHSRIDDLEVPLGRGASMRFLYADGSKRHSFNENSLVVRIDLGEHRVLIMGDAEAGGRDSPSTVPKASSVEGKLLACCAADLKADVLVVGHHGSKTSSRKAFLNAVNAKHFIVSSGPTRYASVTLPDEDVLSALEPRGNVFRTDIEDAQCALSPDKIGPDSDGKPGGCDNIVVSFSARDGVTGEYRQLSD